MMHALAQSLYLRLTLSLFIAFVVAGFISFSVFFDTANRHQNEVMQLMHRHLAKHVTDHYLLIKNGKPDLTTAKETFHDLMILGANFEFYVLDQSGALLAYSTDADNIKRENVTLEPIQNYLATGNNTFPIYGDDPRSAAKQKVFSAAPITINGENLGYLYVILGSQIYDGITSMIQDSQIMRWGLWLLVIGLGFTFLLTLVITRMLFSPLRRLTKQAQHLRAIGFKSAGAAETATTDIFQGWNSNSKNEIQVLGSTFEELIFKLQHQYDQVLTIDELRKELLTHISHDLRTPLASLLGYLETWELSKDNLDAQQRDEYIRIAQKSAKKISHLIEQLFELAYLDSGNVQVNREAFDITELAHDVMRKFQIQANEKKVALRVEPHDQSVRAVGDIEKLDRVFTNLIENALRHTETGGSITVRLNAASRCVHVEVIDSGIGIPETDLPRIFESHYTAQNSVREKKPHRGLGLAITQKLLALHQTQIKVQSQVNKGTRFLFSLYKARNELLLNSE